MSVTWVEAQRIRSGLCITPGVKWSDSLADQVESERRAWLDVHDSAQPDRTWWTAQLTSGRITGCWAVSVLAASLFLETGWGVETAWCVRDPDGLVMSRYRDTVMVKDQYSALWVVTSGPVEFPQVLSRQGSDVEELTLF